MEINIPNARNQYFGQSALELVYSEAVANSLDAGASRINIDVRIKSFTDPDTLEIDISDNGCGFTDGRFQKFSKLLETEDLKHKGIGRLVYLNYFAKVKVSSQFNGTQRVFVYDDNFDGKSEVTNCDNFNAGTKLEFRTYSKEKVKTYEYLKPASIKTYLLLHFLPNLFSMQLSGKSIDIAISLFTDEEEVLYGFVNSTEHLSLDDLPSLQTVEVVVKDIDLFSSFMVHYSIKETTQDVSPMTALCVDNRTIQIDVIEKNNVPMGYETIFLMSSDYFHGKADNSRKGINLDSSILALIKIEFRKAINTILQDNIPQIVNQNQATVNFLQTKYPHLSGYFDGENVGLINKRELINHAQNRFFSEQREILESEELDENKYYKSLELSARLLTEYVIYRAKIIMKLKSIDHTSPEAEIHNLIVPRYKQYHQSKVLDDIYSNNAWILDDKFMSYSTILSDNEMGELLKSISDDDPEEGDDKRPDIAIVFSKDPSENYGVDVVIVELKKMGLDLAKKEEVISQLKQRARRLVNYYPDKIQRIWFYGIVDFNHEFLRSLKEEEFIELYSSDKCYYKEHGIIPDHRLDDAKIPVSLFVMSYKALFDDAESRNDTFLNILKDGIKQYEKEN